MVPSSADGGGVGGGGGRTGGGVGGSMMGGTTGPGVGGSVHSTTGLCDLDQLFLRDLYGSGMRQSSHDPHIPTTRTPLGYPCEWIGHCYERQWRRRR
jgi:hypothetical protein